MNHYIKKYFHKIAGAGGGGGGGGSPPPPPPPTLKPPKLGDLQAISSYEYIENIDLISDGEIDGFVSERGDYVEDTRLFESVYVNDVAVRQPVDIDASTVAEIDLNFIKDAFKQKFYLKGYFSKEYFIETSISSLNGWQISKSVDGGSLTATVIKGKTEIANSIFNDIISVKSAYNTSSFDTSSAFFKQLRLLNSKFNYSNSKEVEAYLLPFSPELRADQYPFIALKLSLNIIRSDYPYYSMDDFIYLDSDLRNQIYNPLEGTELQGRAWKSPPQKINLAYFYNSNAGFGINGVGINGSVYIFLYQKDDYILQNGVEAVIEHLNKIKLIKPFSKYNYANATIELRNGEELQKPLSLFNKTYLDQRYSSKLRGAFIRGRPVLTLFNSDTSVLYTQYSPNSAYASSGILTNEVDELINKREYNQYIVYHNGLYNGGSGFDNFVSEILNSTGSVRLKSITKSSNPSSVNYQAWSNSTSETQNILTYIFTDSNGGPNAEYLIIFDRATSCFKRTISITNTTNRRNNKATTSQSATTTIDILSSDTVFIKDIDTDIIVASAPQPTQPTTNTKTIYIYNQQFQVTNINLDKYFWGGILRACLDLSYKIDGSDDVRFLPSVESYTAWNDQYVKYSAEPASSITHAVLNPNVSQVYITLNVTVLRDMAHRDITLIKNDGANQSVEAGTLLPSLIRVRIETGFQNKDGSEELISSREYQIKGLIDSAVKIDIGREENNNAIREYSRFILGTENVAKPIELPQAQSDRVRFVRVWRSTAETYSSLIKREIYLEKITEIINIPFSYPFSTICGLKLDSRSLNEIPPRSYDARFKKVFVPSNYFPLNSNGTDKRYILGKNLGYFNSLPSTDNKKIIYKGNWDGTFKLSWTDNPAWITFDLLINRRYGLGNFIEPNQINYWELYKIGRFCDAVDENGLFQGVIANDGGLEPRYAFNGVIADKTNVFDMVKSIISSFRGNLFYSNSEINFTNDRLKPVMSFFNNSNVKDGVFSYSNDRRDLQYNVIEVSFLDREDLFKKKIEYVEDPDDIKNRGILRTTADTFGVSSRAHAKRIGEHIIYSSINEDQSVVFISSLETLLCRPGDLIAINDEVKTLKNHVGRVLYTDLVSNSIYTNISLSSQDFNPSGLTGEISVLIPTGKPQSEDFYDLAKSTSKINIREIYKTDAPMRVTLQATGLMLANTSPSLEYGSAFFINTGCSGFPLMSQISNGVPCSITLANTKQEIYKINSIKELNLNEYEVTAVKFDTGKFAEIEKGETGLLQDFYNSFPSSRNTQVSEGNSDLLQNKYRYDLSYPSILEFTTGNYDRENDFIDISGRWTSVDGANLYNVELISPTYKSKKTTTQNNYIVFEDEAEIGRYTIKVTAKTTGIYPNPISPTAVGGFKVYSYDAPVRTNLIVDSVTINN
jgi:hypothetical protein